MRADSSVSFTCTLLLAAFGSLTIGCKSEVAATESSVASAVATTDSPIAVAPMAAQPRFDEAAFRLEMTAPATLKAGESFSLVITLSAKAPFHVNAEYPHRFKVASTTGGKAENNVVMRDPAKLTASKLELLVPVVSAQAGKGELVGEMAFSVCTDDKCLMEKRPLKAAFLAN